jgi:phage terminase small subunit
VGLKLTFHSAYGKDEIFKRGQMSSNLSLSEEEEEFCQEFLVDLDSKQALIRMNHECDNPAMIGRRLMDLPRIRSRIEVLQEERSKRLGVDAEWVLTAAVELYNRCMATVAVKDKDGVPLGVYKFDSSGANTALKTIGQHVGVRAFKKLVEHTGESGGPIVLWGNQSNALPTKRRPPQPPRRK